MNKPHEGLFKPGISGNPAGKPPGTKNKSNRVLEALEARGFDLIGALVEEAMEDVIMQEDKDRRQRARFKLLDRLCPALRAIEHTGDMQTIFSLNIQHPAQKVD